MTIRSIDATDGPRFCRNLESIPVTVSHICTEHSRAARIILRGTANRRRAGGLLSIPD